MEPKSTTQELLDRWIAKIHECEDLKLEIKQLKESIKPFNLYNVWCN